MDFSIVAKFFFSHGSNVPMKRPLNNYYLTPYKSPSYRLWTILSIDLHKKDISNIQISQILTNKFPLMLIASKSSVKYLTSHRLRKGFRLPTARWRCPDQIIENLKKSKEHLETREGWLYFFVKLSGFVRLQWSVGISTKRLIFPEKILGESINRESHNEFFWSKARIAVERRWFIPEDLELWHS